jgi:trimeric autotransporter adhesin
MYAMRTPRRFHRAALAGLLTLTLLGGLPGVVVHAAPCTTVTSAADDGSPGTLRSAINQVNAAVCNTITFSIGTGPQTIVLGSALPGIFSPVTIDATTQPGYSGTPLIEINNGSAPTNSRGLTIAGGSSTVKGLAITGFGGIGGIGIYALNSGGNIIQGNDVGTNASGATGRGNTVGIYFDSVSNNVVGGTTVAARNVISGNSSNGIVAANSSNNIIQGNYIGTNPAGTAALGNYTGVYISATTGGNANNNTVGGAAAGARNILSGNNNVGVAIDGTGGTATGNIVLGNYIGTNAAGNAQLGNHTGVFISAASNNTVGGTTPEARNVISANVNIPGTGPDASGDGLDIDGTNGPAEGNRVIGNYIGTDASGTLSFPNVEGLYILSANRNTIGGRTAAERNVISGSSINGVTIDGSKATTTGNVVIGNFIGTNATGTGAVANLVGVYIAAADGNTVGGAAGAGNIISGNGDAVAIDARRSTPDATITSAQFNIVQGNYLGTNPAGTAAIPNTQGVYIISGKNNTVATNVISGNTDNGVTIDGSLSATTGNVVQGNYVGTNAAGNSSIANGWGVYVTSAASNLIGGNAAGQGNVISGNIHAGVVVTGSGGSFNTVAGNDIGTDPTGTVAVGNSGFGIEIYGASTNTIGGFDAASGNIIANTSGDGVAVITVPSPPAPANNNSILSNRIFANTGASINLTNGANDGLSTPTLSSVIVTPGASPTMVVSGTVPGAANTQFRIDLFGNPTAVSQASVFLGASTVTTDGAGRFTTMPISYNPSNRFITATATSTTNGDTSRVSGPFGAIGPSPQVRSVSPSGGPTTGGTPVTITGANFSAGATVKFGTIAATGVTVVNATTITATTPAEPSNTGAVNVVVTNADTGSGTLTNGYVFVNSLPGPQPSVPPVGNPGPVPPVRQPAPVVSGPTPVPLPPRR